MTRRIRSVGRFAPAVGPRSVLAAALILWCPAGGRCSAAAGPALLQPGAWSEPKSGVSAESCTLGAGEARRGGWGNYSPNERRYFDEFLPGLFERTLAIDALPPTRGFQWIFTGERASLTIHHAGQGKKLEAWIAFYDSPAFDLLAEKPGRHPQLVQHRVEFQLPATGGPRALAVRLDHKQSLTVSADGVPVLELPWVHAFSRHQLQLTGNSGEASFRLLRPEPRAAVVSVDAARPHQTMLGWGGIGTPTAYRELSGEGRREWWKWVAGYNLLLQREYPAGSQLTEAMDNWDALPAAKAHYYGDNFPNGEVSDFAYNKAIQNLGGFVIFEFWDFPPWIGTDAGRYAAAMVNYCQTAKQKTGRPPLAVGLQNEIAIKRELIEPFVTALRAALDAKGFQDVKIVLANASTLAGSLERLPPYRDNPAVWKRIDFSASNLYDFRSHLRDPDGLDAVMRRWHEQVPDKPFLATEICINQPGCQSDGYLQALNMGQNYHKALTLADAVLISYCWTILNVEQPSYAMTRSLFRIDRAHGRVPAPSSFQLRAYGAYSRRIHRDMVRVEAASGDADLLASAFQGTDGRATMVLLNRGTAPAQVRLNWPGAKLTVTELADPYEQNQVLDAPADPAQPLAVPAGAIVTLSNVPLLELPHDFQVP